MLKIGIIGGSGLDDPDILKNPEELRISTEYGEPSSSLLSGQISGVQTVILARHGRKHQYSPTQVTTAPILKPFRRQG